VTADNQGEIVVWDAASHRRRVTFDAMRGLPLMFMNLSDDGRHLVTGSYLLAPPGLTGDQAVTVTVDLRAAQPSPRRLPAAGVVAAAYTAGGRTLIVRRQNGRLQEVDPDTGRVLRAFAGPTVRGECGAPYLVMSPNRHYLTSACGLNEHQPAGAWDVGTGREIWRDPAVARAWRAINDQATMLVRGDMDGTITVVDIRSGRTRKANPGHTAPMTITWSPDGHTFTTSSLDFTSVVWDAATLQQRVVLRGPTGRISGTAYSPDSRTLYTASYDHNVYVWDLDGAARLAQPIGATPVSSTPTEYSRFNQAGTILAALFPDTGQLQIHQLDPSHPRNYMLTGPQVQQGYGLDLDAAGRTAAVLSMQPPTRRLVAHILDVGSREFRPFTLPVDAPPPAPAATGDGPPPAALSLSADGATLTTIDFHGRMRQWDTTTGAPRAQFSYQASGPALYLARSPDPGLIAVTTGLNTIELVDLDRRQRLWTTTITRASNTGRPVFSRDGRLMAVPTWQGEIAVIDTRTETIQRQWLAADGLVFTLAFTPDGRYLVSGGADGRAVLWRLDTAPAGSAVIDVDRLTGADIGVYAPDDRHIITVNPIGPVLSWDIEPASLIARACRIAARNLTDDEWKQLLPNRRYQPTCP
jgi:WD40 repeat protein